MSLKKDVYNYLRTIPKGKVVTYSQLAKAVGHPKAYRAVGNILHNNPDPVGTPCFKVVNQKGMLAKNFGDGIENQRQRLINEGIEVVDHRVDLNKYQLKD